MAVIIKGVPSLGKGLTENTVLWRYLDMAKFLDLLQNNTLYFCRGDRFADKYEGAFTESIKHAIEEAFHKNQIDMSVAEFKNQLRQRVFVNCWHASSDDSMAMWSLYGKSAAAVAITTTVGRLRDAIKLAKLPHAINIAKVEYVKHWRDPALVFKPYSNVFAYKLKAYDYEREVRVIIDRFDEYLDATALPEAMSAVVSLPALLRSIVVSPEASPWFVKLVDDIVRKYDVSVPVRRSKLAFDPK
ncbi:hypothetical protein ParKJ_10290 [Paraburkholderia fungorum]|uniref:DUF2971 domain-containing protein n=1 Tax=Paraburkholderia fungorum TaxID=134537 RepID=A0AAP5Q6E7_9BURK|nr:hypothetical protein [Paraburkholderia fungorum]MDT8837801.1 hypothetical protein [Paraburkholderia fungorum]